MNITEKLLLKDLVIQFPVLSKIFEESKLDFCCGGNKTLEEACLENKLDVNEIIKTLSNYVNTKDINEIDWANHSCTDLVENILNTHHVYIKEEIPQILNLLEKVCNKHKDSLIELVDIQKCFKELVLEINSHMEKEENILFPAILELEKNGFISTIACVNKQNDPCATIKHPITQMELEHEMAGDKLKQIRELTKNYTPPKDACTSFCLLYKKLQTFEEDLHVHIHKENYILFPNAIKLESSNK